MFASIGIISQAKKPVQNTASSLNKITVNSNPDNPMGYIEYLPQNYSSQSDWPVIIWYHGAGEPGPGTDQSLEVVLNTQISNFLKTNDIPFVVLAPQDNLTSGNFTSEGLETFYEWARTKYGAKTDLNSYHVQVLSASGLGLRQWIESNKPSLATVNTITASASTIASTGSVGDWDNLIPLSARVWFHHQVNDGTVSIGGQRGFYSNLVTSLGGQDFDRYRFTAYNENGHSCWTYLYSGLGTSKPQLTGRVTPPNNATVGDYYEWTIPETWFSWMRQEIVLVAPSNLALSSNTINENTTGIIGQLSADGSALITYDRTGGANQANFSINEANQLVLDVAVEYNNFQSLNVEVTASNSEGSVAQLFTIGINEVIEPVGIAWESKLDFSLSLPAFDATWNAIQGSPHLLDQQSGGSPIPIIDTQGISQGVTLYVLGNENGIWGQFSSFGSSANDAGTETGDNTGIYPDSVMAGYWYQVTSNILSTRIRYEGLDPAKTYNLYFFGSRESSTGRITDYTINGVTKSLIVSNNTTNEVEFLAVSPDANGHITITLSESGDSDFIYLNAARIQENN